MSVGATGAAEIGASLPVGTALPARDLMRVVESLSRYVPGAARALVETRRAVAFIERSSSPRHEGEDR